MRTSAGIVTVVAALSSWEVAAQPAAPVLLFNMTLQNTARAPLTQSSVTTPNLDLQTYGDGANIIVATGAGPNLPRLFFGLCKGPCGFTLRDRSNQFDLRGRARITFTTIVSGFHRVRPIVRLADGTLLIGDQANGLAFAMGHRLPGVYQIRADLLKQIPTRKALLSPGGADDSSPRRRPDSRN